MTEKNMFDYGAKTALVEDDEIPIGDSESIVNTFPEVKNTTLGNLVAFIAAEINITDYVLISNTSSANTANAIVRRDASGNFIASNITANRLIIETDGTAANPAFGWNDNGFYRPTSNSVALSTNAVQRFYADADGIFRFGVGSGGINTGGTTAGISLDSSANIGRFAACRDTQPCIVAQRASNNGTVAIFLRNAATVGDISVTTTNTTYNTSSDYRLKNAIDAPITVDAVKHIEQLALRLRWFNWKADESVVTYGFFAHEAQEVYSGYATLHKDAVNPETGEPEYQGIDYSVMVPTLIKAVAELSAQVKSLQALVAGE
jgi:hypothetical protein